MPQQGAKCWTKLYPETCSVSFAFILKGVKVGQVAQLRLTWFSSRALVILMVLWIRCPGARHCHLWIKQHREHYFSASHFHRARLCDSANNCYSHATTPPISSAFLIIVQYSTSTGSNDTLRQAEVPWGPVYIKTSTITHVRCVCCLLSTACCRKVD